MRSHDKKRVQRGLAGGGVGEECKHNGTQHLAAGKGERFRCGSRCRKKSDKKVRKLREDNTLIRFLPMRPENAQPERRRNGHGRERRGWAYGWAIVTIGISAKKKEGGDGGNGIYTEVKIISQLKIWKDLQAKGES